MMGTGDQLDPGLLSDYVAGELDAQTLRDVERYLAASPADQERVRVYQAQSRMLYRAYASVLDEPVPARLLDLLRDRH
ncbi:NepR family anti-sigma factor [Aquisalimonas sp.]|uniref:anti-sigma factor family protein n=1 Tax=Aquisalimonas sp. TaxID=1872621 RepID=UPI0025BA7220|nr:NepR family anti-sigma factor [Aquisalimonas sp.]